MIKKKILTYVVIYCSYADVSHSGTYEEFYNISAQSLIDEATDNDRLTLFTGRFAYETISLISAIAAIQFISNNEQVQATILEAKTHPKWEFGQLVKNVYNVPRNIWSNLGYEIVKKSKGSMH